MKQFLFGLMLTGILLPMTAKVMAQQSPANLFAEMAIALPASKGNVLAPENINPKAKRLFENEFRSVSNAQWLQLKDGQMAGFTSNETRYAVYFNSNGSKAGSIKGYASCKLANEILQMVEADYPGYKITYVNEVEVTANGKTPVYLINIAGAKEDIKVIKLTEGETEVAFDSNDPASLVKRF